MARLIDIIRQYNYTTNMFRLSCNPNLTLSEAKVLLSEGYDISLSYSPYLTMKDVIHDLEYKWDWDALSEHKNITMLDILRYPCFTWNYAYISINPNLTVEYVISMDISRKINNMSDPNCHMYDEECGQNDDNCYCWAKRHIFLFSNPSLPISFILEKYQDMCYCCEISDIMANPNMTLDIIENYLSRDCEPNNRFCQFYKFKNSFDKISKNPNITFEFIKKYITKNWDWTLLTIHPNIKIQDIFDNPTYPWKPNYWDNPNIMPNDLISKNILEDKPWFEVSKSVNVSIEYILNHKEYPWNWAGVSANPNLTIQHISENPDILWDFFKIYDNPMGFHPIVAKRNIIKKYQFIIRELSSIICQYIN